MAYMILNRLHDQNPQAVMATVITSYALSSILTGAIFLLLGVLRLGDLVSFFPRSILLGCIGGVGVFLVLTGIEVSAGLDSNMDWDLNVLERRLWPTTLVLWILPLTLSILLMVIRHYLTHPVVLPAFFILLVAIFYIVFAALPNISLSDMQQHGWIFAAPEEGVPFYNFYTYYSECFNRVCSSYAETTRLQTRQLERHRASHPDNVCALIFRHHPRANQRSSSGSRCPGR